MPPSRRRRTRTGCLTCRARRIKCDEAAAICTQCLRSDLQCLRSRNESLSESTRSRLAFTAKNNDQRLTQAGTRRQRIQRSCVSCKLIKKRCNGERPLCDRCLKKNQPCVYGDDNPPSDTGNSISEDRQVTSSISRLSFLSPPATTVDFPDRIVAQDLCQTFFDEIAPLRCLGFLHRHIFLQHVQDCKDGRQPLLLSVCALATKSIKHRQLWEIGCRWARIAQGLVLGEVQDISVHRLMCIVLLYEHAARISEHRLCFILSGLASRYTQALSLNLEYDHDVLSTTGLLSPVERESRRRLMWACYIMDTMVACGLNHLQTIDTTTIQIQLPCDDRYFLYKVARVTAKVPICFESTANRDAPISTENQDTHAFLVRLFLIRDRILRYVHDHADEEDPWRLMGPLADLEHWKDSLPPELQFNHDVIAIRKEQSMLSALISLHVQYHQINCLLYRCTIPSMLFPARAHTGLSRKASIEFLSDSRRGWFDHACAMSAIFKVALEQKPESMEDPAVGFSTYNAIIIKFLYLTNFVPPEERLLRMESILPLVDIDLQFLRELHDYHPSVRSTCLAAERLVDEAKMKISLDPTITLSESGNLVGVFNFPTDSISLDHRTNQLSTIAQIRKNLPEMHAPDLASVPLGCGTQSPGDPGRLWLWIDQTADSNQSDPAT
uniref:Zn(2)-C6 fungal-type domain-containing protein n=1 Tax=Bionectria ochroleuca TaxID=29856 RepID=A0A8H7TKJ6_BIOOC